MNAPNAANAETAEDRAAAGRARLARERSIADRFGLQAGGMYRVAYMAGGPQSRRVCRSLVIFGAVSRRRRWDGDVASCLDFALPQGRPLSLLSSQIIDVRPAGVNERGQWVLLAQGRAARRRRTGTRAARECAEAS